MSTTRTTTPAPPTHDAKPRLGIACAECGGSIVARKAGVGRSEWAHVDERPVTDITEHIQSAFAAVAAAREQLDTAEDNVRALVTDAIASGMTWDELETISGQSNLALQHRYQIAAPGQVETVPADPLWLLP